MSINYKGNFINQLYKAIEKNPDLTLGELLFSFLREQRLKKHYFYTTDEEIYNSLEKLNKEFIEGDSLLNDKDFAFWAGKNLYRIPEEELYNILAIEEKKQGEDKQGFMFAIEQLTIIKK